MRHHFTDLNRVPLLLQLGGFTSEILGWGFYSGEAWWRNYLHAHSFFEVCYAFCGRGRFRIGGRDCPVQAGDLFIAKPDEAHEIVSDDAAPLGIYFWSYTLVPPAGASHRDVDAMLHAFSVDGAAVASGVGVVEKTLELLTDEVARGSPGYAQVVEGLALKLILETARAVSHVQPPTVTNGKPGRDASKDISKDVAVTTMLRYIRDNYNRPLSLKEVAAQVHLSERHTSRLFKRAVGTSVKQHVLDLRLDVAKQLLLNEKTSVAEVAYATGYGDVRHFSTLFRQRTGTTPTDYRERGGTRFL